MTYKRSNDQKVNAISPKKFQIYPGPSMRSKTDKCEYLRGPTQKIFNFFFSGLYTSSMNGFCMNWKWLVFLLLKSQSTQCAYLKVFTHISEIQQGRIMKCLICFFVHMDMPVLIVYIFGRFILQPREKGWMSEIKALWFNFKMLSNVCFDLIFNSPEKMLKILILNTWVRTHS